MSEASLIVMLIGDDRPGLVEAVSRVITEHHGNWLESRMAHLADKFAGILRVTVPESELGGLCAALEALHGEGLRVITEPSRQASPTTSLRDLSLELIGQDRPGIVRDISHVLAERGVNVAELRTEITSAPMTAEPLFRARALLHAPRDLDIERMRRALESLADELMVDIALEDDTSRHSPS